MQRVVDGGECVHAANGIVSWNGAGILCDVT